MGRAVAPLRQAEGAVLVDSSTMDFDATLARMVRIATEGHRS
jgi:cytidylate kinase